MAPERGGATGRSGSSSERPRCKGSRADGEPCGAPPEFVDPETGLCPSHQEGASERLREAGRRGAEATKRRYSGGGLVPEDLPPLTSHEAAEAWTDAIGRAAATGNLSGAAANAAMRAVETFLSARERSESREKLEQIRREIAEAAGEGDADLEVLR